MAYNYLARVPCVQGVSRDVYAFLVSGKGRRAEYRPIKPLNNA